MNERTIDFFPTEENQAVNALMPSDEYTTAKDGLKLKRKINELVWEECGPQTTLKQAENIACKIFWMIHKTIE